MAFCATQSQAFLASQPRLANARPLAAKKVAVKSAFVANKRTQRKSIIQAALPPENYITEVPDSLCRDGVDAPNSMRRRFEKLIRAGQASIVSAIEEIDGSKFRQDAWTREGGGGGITRVLQGGNVWEKAGVAVSVVYGSMPAEAYRVAVGKNIPNLKDADRVPFFACGISSVMHPWNPHCPTMHFNYRYFETEDWNGIPGQWWFGGGTDITPSYVNEEDMKHFHGTYKAVCERHNQSYEKMKKACDEYFLIGHRKETRGLGGIFYEDLNDRDPEEIFAFAGDALNNVVESYCPIIRKHKDDPYTPEQKQWQQLRRGRYVEFNLVYDRGTIFGLKTGGRIESILMSMPLTSSWMYDHEPEKGSPEADFLDAARHPRNWV